MSWPAKASALAVALIAACAGPRVTEPQVIAHRGNSSEAPENTLAAVRSALSLPEPIPYVEIDLHATADGELVVIHDTTLDRTCDRGGEVAQLTFQEVRAARAGFASEFGDAFSGELVPSLDEVLDAVRDTNTDVMIEIKPNGLGDDVARRIAARGELDRHVIASFHADVVLAASLAEPRCRTVFVVGGEAAEEHVELAGVIGAEFLAVNHEAVTPELLSRAHALDIVVWAWTVDDETRAAELLRLGADGIITNRPRAIRPERPSRPGS